ncbi:MAG: hypothetical protein ABJC13_20350 [Acidobacteriota bacterium]
MTMDNGTSAPRSIQRVVALLACAMIFACTTGSQAIFASGTGAPWKRIRLKESPVWISSAEWADKFKSILLVDPIKKELILIAPDGMTKRVSGEKFGNLERLQPLAVNKVGGEFFLKLPGARTERLDSMLLPKGEVALSASEATGGIASLYQWTSNGKSVFGYGPVFRNGSSDFTIGFFRSPLEKPSNVTFFSEFEDADYYVIGFPFITSVGDSFFYVAMRYNYKPSLFRVDAGSKEPFPLDALRVSLNKTLPVQTSMDGAGTVAQLFRELEGYDTPAGLFSQDGFLYLLTRSPESNQGTAWKLHKIDPSGRGNVIGSIQLPTTANFLSVVTSPDNWYFIERKEVQEGSRQDIPSMIVIESSVIRNLRELSRNPQR